MGDSEEPSRKDIPEVEVIKAAALESLGSGRSRSFESLELETAKRLGLSPKQRKYRIAGSATALFANRVEKARSELHGEGLIEYPARGKARLTEAGKAAVSGAQPYGEPCAGPSAVCEHSAASGAHIESVAPVSPETPTSVEPACEGKPYQPGSFEGGIVMFPAEPQNAAQPDSAAASSRLPIVLAVVGILLSCTGVLAFAGVACGIASLVLFVRSRRNSQAVRAATAPKASAAFAACSVVLGIALIAGGASAGKGHDDAQAPPADPATTSQQREAAAERPDEPHVLSFVVEADDARADSFDAVTVLVSGKRADGKTVSDKREATVGKTYQLSYPAGSYAFSVDPASLTRDETIFSAGSSSYAFDGSEDHVVHIKIAPDEEAMRAAQAAREEAAQQKAAEEAAAQQKADEEAAAAAAAAEEEAAAAAAAAAAASSGGDAGGDTVYGTKTGERYHRDGCSSLRKSKIPMTRSEAESRGLTPCQNCNP